MRFRLRTLLIVLALGPMVLAGAWFSSIAVAGFLASPEAKEWEPMQELAMCCTLVTVAVLFAVLVSALTR